MMYIRDIPLCRNKGKPLSYHIRTITKGHKMKNCCSCQMTKKIDFSFLFSFYLFFHEYKILQKELNGNSHTTKGILYILYYCVLIAFTETPLILCTCVLMAYSCVQSFTWCAIEKHFMENISSDLTTFCEFFLWWYWESYSTFKVDGYFIHE